MATFVVDICSGTDRAGNQVRYDRPEPVEIDPAHILMVGTYVGADNRAWGVIYLDPPSNAPEAVLIINVAQSPMTINHRRHAARTGALAATKPMAAPASVMADTQQDATLLAAAQAATAGVLAAASEAAKATLRAARRSPVSPLG